MWIFTDLLLTPGPVPLSDLFTDLLLTPGPVPLSGLFTDLLLTPGPVPLSGLFTDLLLTPGPVPLSDLFTVLTFTFLLQVSPAVIISQVFHTHLLIYIPTSYQEDICVQLEHVSGEVFLLRSVNSE
jgi:hypothetical protein